MENYYGEVNENELVDAAVSGMLDTLDDPYSVFMDKNDTDSFLQSVDGSFVGIGVSVQWSEDTFKIIEVMEDSPAAKAGFKVDDIIIAVDEKDIIGIYALFLLHIGFWPGEGCIEHFDEGRNVCLFPFAGEALYNFCRR